MKRIGFGTTALQEGLSRGHVDGIGVYTKNLWEAFAAADQGGRLTKQAISFGRNNSSQETNELLGEIIYLPPSYAIQAARSIISGKPFLGSETLEREIDLFFAPDHHIPRLKHKPVIATIHDAYPLIYPKLVSRRLRWFKNKAFKYASHWADHIITISEHSKRDIIRYFDISKEKISVIPNGVNPMFMERIPEETKESVCRKYGLSGRFYLFVGTIQPRKNLSRVIEAYTSLSPELRQKHPLVIVGHYGWGEEQLKQKLESLGKTDTIFWLKDVTDKELYAILQSALAMVHPSLYEGFGLPILEGFASQIPIITSATTSIPEVAADAACYIDPLSTADIAAKMEQIAQDEALRATLIHKGWQRVQHYSWERTAAEHLKLFRNYL
ncbi:MAG TPA: glycosyltransferase family 1 protein [Epsilonproteobacteria bacterium]|nr:glycosyltransferase family 1 protein [Campylobacterota bacterium]